MGLFTQFQVVFACEFIDGKIQYVCCCDEQVAMTNDLGCAKISGYLDEQQVGPASIAASCCEMSYQQIPATLAISSKLHDQQVLLIDAPQPPPILVSFMSQTMSAASQAGRNSIYSPARTMGPRIYLLSKRFRI